MSGFVREIIIVGGGTAGWLTAAILAADLQAESGFRITLIESPDVNTIGVGEGTWPSMRTTLKKIGVSEVDLIKECSASFKQGSKFVGWKNGLPTDVYYHPFTLPAGYGECNLLAAWQSKWDSVPFADAVCIQSHISEKGLAPKQITTPEYAGAVNYGYHFDAGKFAMLLQKHCTKKLRVRHILDHVVNVVSALNGDIAEIDTKKNGAIKGDIFIDCTGSACILLGGHYQVPFVDKSSVSINDCALATQIPYSENSNLIASPTIATAQSAGWTWDIGLSTRRGVGYVYSSAHTSDEYAELELRRYLAKSIGKNAAESVSSHKLSIKSGYREQFWYKNCVAIGMAAGFIEPLEASAIALVELSANMIRDEMPMTRATMEIVAVRFNKAVKYRWMRIIEFLKLHYVLTQRRDSEYWHDVSCEETIPDSLRCLLSLWRHRPPNVNDFDAAEEIFPAASYQYVLYGMGFETDWQQCVKQSDYIDIGLRNINENFKQLHKYSVALPSNRDLIERIFKYGMSKI